MTWVAGSLEEWWETTEDTSRMLSPSSSACRPRRSSPCGPAPTSLLAEYVAADGSLAVPGVARIVVATA